MLNFYLLLEKIQSEEQKNINATLKKIPKKHRKLLNGFKIHFSGHNTLEGDKNHIGSIYMDKIKIAAPWNYGREFTLLHEIAHLLWEKIITDEQKKEWSKVVKKNKHRLKQNDEELFCMAYANTYARHKIKVHTNSDWEKFINNL